MQPLRPALPSIEITAKILERAAAISDKSALQILRPQGAERWSYGKLAERLAEATQAFRNLGLPAESPVLIALSAPHEVAIHALAAQDAGLYPLIGTAEGHSLPAITRESATLAQPELGLTPEALIAGEALTSSKAAAQPPEIAAPAGRLAVQGLAEGERCYIALAAIEQSLNLLLDCWAAGATALLPNEGVRPAQIPLLLKRFDTTILVADPALWAEVSLPPLRLPKLMQSYWAALDAQPAEPSATLAELWAEVQGHRITPIAPQ